MLWSEFQPKQALKNAGCSYQQYLLFLAIIQELLVKVHDAQVQGSCDFIICLNSQDQFNGKVTHGNCSHAHKLSNLTVDISVGFIQLLYTAVYELI